MASESIAHSAKVSTSWASAIDSEPIRAQGIIVKYTVLGSPFSKLNYSGSSHKRTPSGHEKGVRNWSWQLTGM